MYKGVCVWGGGGRLAGFITFFLNTSYLAETKFFHFHKIFKNGRRGGGVSLNIFYCRI